MIVTNEITSCQLNKRKREKQRERERRREREREREKERERERERESDLLFFAILLINSVVLCVCNIFLT